MANPNAWVNATKNPPRRRPPRGPQPRGGTFGNPRAIKPEHVLGIRKVLREHGYQVNATGQLTDRLLDAWRNYRRGIHYGTGRGRGAGNEAQTGARTVAEWNKQNPIKYGPKSGALHTIDASRPAKMDFVSKAAKRSQTHARARQHAQRLGASGGSGGGGPNFPGVPSPPDGGSDVNKLLPRSMADQLAGLQFDPQIQQVLTQINQGGRDEAQHQADIGNWYGQVEGAQGTARERDAAAGAAARSSTQDAVQAILQSLGGSRGAGVVGAAGVNDIAGLAAQGQAQDQYNNDLAPLLRQEEAGAHSREQALGSQRSSALNQQLTGLRGQRGQAQAQALMQLIQANNQSRQANFGNRMSLASAALAASELGLKADQVNAMLGQYGIQNQLARQKLKAGQQQLAAASGHHNWATLDAPSQQALIDNAIKTAYGAIPAGTAWDPRQLMNRALATIRAQGYQSARRVFGPGGKRQRVPNAMNQAAILGLLRQRMAYFHGQHPDQQ